MESSFIKKSLTKLTRSRVRSGLRGSCTNLLEKAVPQKELSFWSNLVSKLYCFLCLQCREDIGHWVPTVTGTFLRISLFYHGSVYEEVGSGDE